MPVYETETFKFPDEVDSPSSGESPKLIVEIEDDTPPDDRGRQPMPADIVKELESDELDSYDDAVKSRIKQMRKVWHDERREKESALREQREALNFANSVLQENKRMRALLTTGEKEYATTLQNAATMELEAAKRDYKAAYEAGDSDKLVEAQQALQAANLKLIQAKNFKLPPLQEEPDPVKQGYREPEEPKGTKLNPRLVAWQERNPWFGKNKAMTGFVFGFNEELEASGAVETGSEEYFAAIDKAMRQRFPEHFKQDAPSDPSPSGRPKAATVVAPAVRTTSPNRVRLTASEVRIANKLGLTPEQYAMERLKLESSYGR